MLNEEQRLARIVQIIHDAERRERKDGADPSGYFTCPTCKVPQSPVHPRGTREILTDAEFCQIYWLATGEEIE